MCGCTAAVRYRSCPWLALQLETRMDGRNAKSEVLVRDRLKASATQHIREFFLRRKAPNALHEVLVRVPVVGGKRAKMGNDVERVHFIDAARHVQSAASHISV